MTSLQRIIRRALLSILPLIISACTSLPPQPLPYQEAAQVEGELMTVGMPNDWANWGATWRALRLDYKIQHYDINMTSADQLKQFERDGPQARIDMGDVGHTFAPIAVQRGLTQAYKPSQWDDIPDWAKDTEGHWLLAYTGSIAFIIDNHRVNNPPQSWHDLLQGNYTVTIGEVGSSSLSTSAFIAAAIANGGDESNITPGLEFFAELAKQNRLLVHNDMSQSSLRGAGIEVGLIWDFMGLYYREISAPGRYTILIPNDGTLMSGYATVINKYAPHPNAARLAREYILSDAGQINLARGYARPIRQNVQLPAEVQARLLATEQYQRAQPIKNFAAFETMLETLEERWKNEVLTHIPRP